MTTPGTRQNFAACLMLFLAAFITPSADAQNAAFPSKPIRIIVPYSAGGLLDATMRRVGVAITESTGQPVIIDNKPGGMTNIGMQNCAVAPPDGYTVCFTLEDSTIYNPLLYRKMPYDTVSLVPVINLVYARQMVVAHTSAPFNSLKELLAYAKSHPSAVNWATFGPGSTPDINRLWINRTAGTDIVNVPYKGVGNGTLPAVLNGEVTATVLPIGLVLPHIKSGKLKSIAVLGDRRFPGLPGVPALAEEGMDPSLPNSWGVYAPPGTPKAQVDRLNAEFAKAMSKPALRELLETNTLDFVGGSPADFGNWLSRQRKAAALVFDSLGIKPVDAPS